MPSRSVLASLILTVGAMIACGSSLDAQPPAKDRHGDPLPEGAVARFGTARLRAVCDRIVFSTDGKSLIGFDGGHLRRTWNAADGKLLETCPLPGRPEQPSGRLRMELSPDGQTLVIVEGSSLQLWDVLSAQRVNVSLPKDRKRIDHVAVSNDRRLLLFADTIEERWVAAGGGFGQLEQVQHLILWDTTTGKPLSLADNENQLGSLAIAPDGKRVASSSAGQGTRVWDAVTGKVLWEALGKQGALFGLKMQSAEKVAFTPDGRHLIAAPGQQEWHVWDAATGKPADKVRPPTVGQAWTFALAPDGNSLLIPTDTDYVLWDLQEGKILHEWPGARQAGKGVFAPDGRSVVTYDTVLRRWDVKTGKLLYEDVSPLGHMAPVQHLFFAPDGRRLTSIGEDRTARVWDVATTKLIRTIDLTGVDPKAWTATPDGNTLIGAGEKLTVHRWPLDREEPRESYELREAQDENLRLEPVQIRVTPDGNTLVLSGWPRSPEYQYRKYSFSFWDLATGRLRSWGGDPGNDYQGDYAGLSPDGRWAAVRGILHDTRTGEGGPRLTVAGRDGSASTHLFSPDGRWVAASSDGVRVAEVITGRELIHLPEADTYRAAFSPEGRFFASVDWERLRVWDLHSGKVILERPAVEHLRHNKPWISGGITFTPDGSSIATGHPDGNILLWAMPKADKREGSLTEREADALWTNLGAEPAKAYAAVWRLCQFPDEAVKLLDEHFPSVPVLGNGEFGLLIKKLDSERFEEREAASRRLKELGRTVEGSLRQALKEDLTAEQKRRIEAVLAPLTRSEWPQGNDLRAVRAVAVLEGCNTKRARRLLEEWAKGSQSVWLTEEASRAVARLKWRPAQPD